MLKVYDLKSCKVQVYKVENNLFTFKKYKNNFDFYNYYSIIN